MPTIDTLSEVIVYVQDMDRMASFYSDVFGLDIAEGAPEHGFVRFATGGCSLCLHTGANGDLGRDAPKLVFDVDDMTTARAHLQSHDVELADVRSPAPGMEVCDGRDPEGNKFSIEATTGSQS